jgi:hypothetical protein
MYASYLQLILLLRRFSALRLSHSCFGPHSFRHLGVRRRRQGQDQSSKADSPRPTPGSKHNAADRRPYRRDEWHGIISGFDHHDQQGRDLRTRTLRRLVGPHTPHGIPRFAVSCRPERYVDRTAKSTPRPPRTRTTWIVRKPHALSSQGRFHRNGWSAFA